MTNNSPSGYTPFEPSESEIQAALRRIRDAYGKLLARPENEALANRLQALEDKYTQAAELEHQAEVDPDAGLERDNLLLQADQELQQLENEIGEVWWASLSWSEQQLLYGRSQAEIEEMQLLMQQ